MPHDELLFSTSQVAQRLGVARHQLTYRFDRKHLPEPRRICGRRAFSEADLRMIRKFFEQKGAVR